ncbi:MAG: hypothetical protein IT521_05100 [Burkholderiales bacterium]|nr:hypothetical protein [Burkholderiales bacterium]
MIRTLFNLAAAFAVAACASASTQSARDVRDGDPATINRDCKLLGTVNGRSVFGGSEEGRAEGAKLSAREKAAQLGATHIVFLKVDTSGMLNTGYATARAYRCPDK